MNRLMNYLGLVLTLAGSEFNNSIMKELFRVTGIVHKPMSSYHPQGNGKYL